jgi:hypothetical protein
MLTVEDAFRKFKSRLELNEREQRNASNRHTEVRDFLRDRFQIDRDFLTGSYARHTKTKPLKDVDIFFVLGGDDRKYREKNPDAVLTDFHTKLAKEYGEKAVRIQDRSVSINFGVVVDADDNTDYRILSVDAVPAVSSGSNYEIPDRSTGKWIKTNPETHAEEATRAHQNYGSEWKGLVRMIKYWNNNAKHGEKPVKPSFLVEVMALQCLHGGWGGRFDYEVQAFFSTLADQLHSTWADPAGLGPNISDGMTSAQKDRGKQLLLAAAREADLAINHTRQGRNGDALKAWRSLFGPKFPLS